MRLESYVHMKIDWLLKSGLLLALLTLPLVAGSITTTFGENDGASGAMFNLTVGGEHSLIVDGLSLLDNSTADLTLDVYIKTGTYNGFQTDPNAWTLVSATDVPKGNGSATPTDVSVTPFYLASGKTYGIYVTFTTTKNPPDMLYTRGSNTYSNSDLSLSLGAIHRRAREHGQRHAVIDRDAGPAQRADRADQVQPRQVDVAAGRTGQQLRGDHPAGRVDRAGRVRRRQRHRPRRRAARCNRPRDRERAAGQAHRGAGHGEAAVHGQQLAGGQRNAGGGRDIVGDREHRAGVDGDRPRRGRHGAQGGDRVRARRAADQCRPSFAGRHRGREDRARVFDDGPLPPLRTTAPRPLAPPPASNSRI